MKGPPIRNQTAQVVGAARDHSIMATGCLKILLEARRLYKVQFDVPAVSRERRNGERAPQMRWEAG